MGILKNLAKILLVIFLEVILYVYNGFGVIIGSLLILAIIVIIREKLRENIKYRNNEKEWIIAILSAIFISLVSFPVGLVFIGQIIAVPILDILIACFILSIFYAVIRKNPKVFLKIFLVAALVSVIVFFGWFDPTLSEASGLFVSIEKYDSIEEMSKHVYSENKTFHLLTEEDLNKYPGIKKAIDECVNSNKCTSKVDKSEWELRNLINQYVKINGRYYLLDFYWSD